MSIPVPIDELPTQLRDRPAGYVITTASDGRPHVAHQPIAWVAETGSVVFPAGASTVRNVTATPAMCVLFPAIEGIADGYSLIVDATAQRPEPADTQVTATPTHAVLHRPAPAS